MMNAVRMSNRQVSLIRRSIEEGGLTLEEMLAINQGTAGSLAKSDMLRWDRQSERFIPTSRALEVADSYDHANIGRKTLYRPLSVSFTDRSLISWAARVREGYKEQAREQEARDRQAESNGVVKMKTRTDEQRAQDRAKRK